MENPSGSIDPQEIAKFTAMAEEWWNAEGKFRPLHRMNPVRLQYIRDQAAQHFGRDPLAEKPLAGLRLLDIGAGGGLLSEPLCRLGAEVTGIDAAEKNVAIARLHAEQMGLPITYLACPVEALPREAVFDIVLAMEVIEHVADPELFLCEAAARLRPGGLLFVATLNRTLKSYALAIIGAEYILRWLPRGTHDWKKFLRPSEVARHLRHAGLLVTDTTGLHYAPLQDAWRLSRDLDVNYVMLAVK